MMHKWRKWILKDNTPLPSPPKILKPYWAHCIPTVPAKNKKVYWIKCGWGCRVTTLTCSWTEQQVLCEKLLSKTGCHFKELSTHVKGQPATLLGGRSTKSFTTVTLYYPTMETTRRKGGTIPSIQQHEWLKKKAEKQQTEKVRVHSRSALVWISRKQSVVRDGRNQTP